MRRIGGILVLLLFAAAAGMAQTEARHTDHEELRAMLVTATNALNARNYDALTPLFAPDAYITTVDGKAFRGPAAFKAYVDGLYASKIQSIAFHPVADTLTTFYGDNDGVCAGSSTDTYHFKDGDARTMTSRWTATVHKNNGRWQVAALHMSANVLDNPVTQATRSRATQIVVVALLAGLIAGFLLGRFTTRRA
jgi:uncharacterized protein (TIGR02246 family)